MPGAAIVMRDRTTCEMPLTAAYYHNDKAISPADKQQLMVNSNKMLLYSITGTLKTTKH